MSFQKFFSKSFNYLVKFFCLYFLLTCAAEQNPDDPGQCTQKTECDGAKIASYDMRIRFLEPFSEGDVVLNCGALGDSTPIPLRFLVQKPRTVLPSEIAVRQAELGTTKAAGNAISEDADLEFDPVSSISFQAFLIGGGGNSSFTQQIIHEYMENSNYQPITQGIVSKVFTDIDRYPGTFMTTIAIQKNSLWFKTE